MAGEPIAEIGAGLLIYLGIAPTDQVATARRFASRLATMRIFPDERQRMSLSVLEVDGAALVVSQFTLFGDLRRGHRPSFASAGDPALGQALCRSFVEELGSLGLKRVREGIFGEHMLVEATNDGPVTMVASLNEPPWETACG